METSQMTAETNKPLMRDYWAKYRARLYIAVTTAQCSAMLLLFALLELFGVTNGGWMMPFILAFVGAALLNLLTITLIHLLGRPFRDLVQAIVLVAGEPSAGTPPNPNTYEFNKDGFKEILQTVYELAAKAERSVEQPETIDSHIKSGLNATKTGLIIMNAKQEIVYYNNAAPVRENTDNKPAVDVFFPEDDQLDTWLKSVHDKLTAEHVWTRISDKLPGEKDRRLFDVAVSYNQKSNAEIVLTFFDRTSTYMPEEDNLDFISFAAHELRGPITVIRGYLDVLEEELQPVLEHDQAELLQRLSVSANRLTSYINNILSASSYDRRHMKLHLNEDTMAHIYEGIADDMQLRAKTQNRVLVVDIAKELPTVAADSNAIGEVLSNLIDNAIKYSNEGGLVHVTAKAIPGFVEVSVVDRGIGMPSNVLANLFHKFYRSHRSRETVAGTGIGLYICKAIVSSHGGSISARSVENEGSTFSFTVPIYDTVADKIKARDNSNVSLIPRGGGWIRNHSMYKRLD